MCISCRLMWRLLFHRSTTTLRHRLTRLHADKAGGPVAATNWVTAAGARRQTGPAPAKEAAAARAAEAEARAAEAEVRASVARAGEGAAAARRELQGAQQQARAAEARAAEAEGAAEEEGAAATAREAAAAASSAESRSSSSRSWSMKHLRTVWRSRNRLIQTARDRPGPGLVPL